MRRPSALPDGLDASSFSTSEARRLEVSRQRTRSITFVSPFYGVRADHIPSSTLERALSYSKWMAPSQFFSHISAAELLRLRLPDGLRTSELHVSSVPPHRAPRSHGVIGHQQSLLFPLVDAHGLRVSHPIDTWLSLGASHSVDALTIMGDGLVSRKQPVTDLAGLGDALMRASGWRGSQQLRAALRQIRPNTDSARETMLRLFVMRAGFPEPEVNGAVVNSLGAPIAHGDLVYRAYRAILEYDGGHHRENERQFNIDIDRLDQLMEEEWRVIRVNRSLMARKATLIGKIETALNRGGWRRQRE